MVLDVKTRKPKISNGMGGLSGPAIRPIAVRMVYECRQTVKIPIIGMGGIVDARDALEFMIAGATAVQVGTTNFVDPLVWGKILDGMRGYMERHQIAKLADIVGTVNDPAHSGPGGHGESDTRCARRRHGGGGPCAGRSAARACPRLQDRQPPVHEPRAVNRRGAR